MQHIFFLIERNIKLSALLLIFFLMGTSNVCAQAASQWLQHVEYKMDVHLDVETHKVKGTQQVAYTNNSPDTLHQFYYHLYFNAFQPNSMMDTRSRWFADPDRRVRDRIFNLSEDEIGYQKIEKITQDGKAVDFKVEDTVMEVELAEPIMPGQTVTFDLVFNSQVPLQIRRSGRDNAEGIDFTMTQWYPKIAEYDEEGWNAFPYVAREFYGVWGNFDVTITLDSAYTIGGTGVLQNPEEVGHGYLKSGMTLNRPDGDELTWHFKANNVHDFAWAADENYTHDTYRAKNGQEIHLFYVDGPRTKAWKKLGEKTAQAMAFIEEHVGPYQFPQFSVIQGGDGGMEYAMSTMITGNRSEMSLVGVTVHEMLHSWFMGMLAFNESKYAWLDEGFTSYWESRAFANMYGIPGNPHWGSHNSYLRLKYFGLEEPTIYHADYFETNTAHSTSAYSKSAAFLDQLEYVIGRKALEDGFKRLYNEWAFKHPQPRHVKRAFEKASGIELDWYFQIWEVSTEDIDYAVKSVEQKEGKTSITLERKGKDIMPVDLLVTYEDGTKELHYIPLGIMRGEKKHEDAAEFGPRFVHKDWMWTSPTYTFDFANTRKIAKVELDPTVRLNDVNRLNNTVPFPLEVTWLNPIRPEYKSYNLSARPAFWYGENAGLIGGLRTYGEAFLGDKSLRMDLMLSTGSVDDYSARNTDVDFLLDYNQKIKRWGNEASINFDVRRFYGIYEASVALKKGLHEFGVLSKYKRFISFKAFVQNKTQDRQIAMLNNAWQAGEIMGMEMLYEAGQPATNGYTLKAVAASHNNNNSPAYASASFVEFDYNRTMHVGKKIDTRFNLSFGLGSENMPTQYRWNLTGPTYDQLWRNTAYTSVLNIDPAIAEDAYIIPSGQSAFMGYAHQAVTNDIGSTFGNNYMQISVWNTYKSNPRSLHALELFAGTGKSWNGSFINDNPFAKGGAKPFLASAGVGYSYDISRARKLASWTAQSDLLKDLKLSLRVPFYNYGIKGVNELTPLVVFGISDSF